uniref:Secreted protein n=1 Tax=Setaria viridis TaxID=4556 RepID=A0A4U6UII2_SETVI|nr:hypothetical protein SEVIR_5G174801v2 [Setaria viridis]
MLGTFLLLFLFFLLRAITYRQVSLAIFVSYYTSLKPLLVMMNVMDWGFVSSLNNVLTCVCHSKDIPPSLQASNGTLTVIFNNG